MDSSFWFDTILWDGPLYISSSHKLQILNKNCISFSEDHFVYANSVFTVWQSMYLGVTSKALQQVVKQVISLLLI